MPTNELDDDDPIAQAFWDFHNKNPEIYDEIVKISKQLKDRGREHYGIGAIFEVIRFHRAINTTDTEFKLNNNYRALYARLIMKNESDLDDFFETRIRIAKIRHNRTQQELESWFF